MLQPIKVVTTHETMAVPIEKQVLLIAPDSIYVKAFNCLPNGKPINNKILETLGIKYRCA